MGTSKISATLADIEAALTAFREAGYPLNENNISAVADTVASVSGVWGWPTNIHPFIGVTIWENIQFRNGARRGDLVAFAINGGSIIHFGGER